MAKGDNGDDLEIGMTGPAAGGGGIEARAAEWHARLDAPDMDWDAFGAWLDADPAHRDAYDAVALLDADLLDRREAVLAALPTLPANDDESFTYPVVLRTRRWWVGGGLGAAALVAALVGPQLPLFTTAAMVAYRTGPSETRMIDLKDGSHILLDRNSRLALADGAEPRVEMERGGAYFDVRHDPSRAFRIKVGDYEVRDIGTRFDLAMTTDRLAVAVAEGKLTVAPAGGEGTALVAGERIDVAMASGEARVAPVASANVGAWRQGRLVYQGAPLALVASDVARYAGRPISVDPAIDGMRVSGVLTIGDGSRLLQQIEALLPVRAVEQDGSIRLVGSGAR